MYIYTHICITRRSASTTSRGSPACRDVEVRVNAGSETQQYWLSSNLLAHFREPL